MVNGMRILVVEVRGLHIGFLGCYGNEWIATPNLDRLAAEGVVFDRHYHDCPDLLRPSNYKNTVRLDALADFGQAALAAWRRSSESIVWTDGPNLAPPWKLPEDLRDVYFDEGEEGEPWLDPPTDLVPSLTVAELLELQNTCAAAVTWCDAQLGVLVDALRAGSELDQTLVCVTASAGLPLGEHGEIGPARAWLHEERVHVPLIMRFPRQEFAGLRIAALTQPCDLSTTFDAVMSNSVSPSSRAAGQNLLPLLRGEVDAVRSYACSRLQAGDSAEWALRTPEWAYLLPVNVPEGDPQRGPQLYVKPDDRWEVNDVHQQHSELVEDFERALRANQEEEP
jgi:arylsulfatase A-like enzyme